MPDSYDSDSSDSSSRSESGSDCDGVIARVFKRVKEMCSWPGCDDDIDCELHAERNSRVKKFKGAKEIKNDKITLLLMYPATEDMVPQIFDMEPENTTYVGLFNQYILVTYFKTVSAKARKMTFAKAFHGIEVTALGQEAVKLFTEDIICDTFQERDIVYPTEPTPPTNFMNFLHHGRWTSRHVIQSIIDTMLKNMNGHSKSRKQDFECVSALQKLREAFETNIAGHCGCGRAECDVQLTLNGVMGISPDRRHDHLGYGYAEQIIKLVCKWHNTSFKCDALPTKRAYPEGWLNATTGSTRKKYRARMMKLRKKKRTSAVEKDQLRKFAHFEAMEQLIKKKPESADVERLVKEYMADPDHHSIANIRCILIELRENTTHCYKCLRELLYGDEGDSDIMTLAHVSARASADRSENTLDYTGGNTKLVCTSCNWVEKEYSRSIIDDVRSKKTPAYGLTPELKELCITYIDALITIEDTDDSDEVKTFKRRAMRKRLFPKPPKADEGESDEDE
jgi:hypothetical protein